LTARGQGHGFDSERRRRPQANDRHTTTVPRYLIRGERVVVADQHHGSRPAAMRGKSGQRLQYATDGPHRRRRDQDQRRPPRGNQRDLQRLFVKRRKRAAERLDE
jgi:hypothetical protein